MHRLIQRRRETGSLAPRKQTKFRSRVLAGQEDAAGGADHRAARCDVGRVARGAADHGGAEHAVARDRSVGVDRQKKRYTPTNNAGLMSRPPAGGGATWLPLRDARQYVFVDECGVTTDLLRRYGRSPRGDAPRAITRPAAIGRRTRWSPRLRLDGLGAPAVFDGPIDNPTLPRLCRAGPRAHAAARRCRRARQPRRPQAARGARGDRAAGAQLRFLPPYSPDFNPIELAFAKLKAFFRAARPRTFDHVCALDGRRRSASSRPTNARNYVRHCGYRVATAL